jgi:hypothetical protein
MSHPHWRSWLCATCVAMLFASEGCSGDGLPRQPIAGFVTLDGQPLSSGAISFYPSSLKDPNYPVSGGAMIKRGYFSIPRWQGLVPGRYEVTINSADALKRRSRVLRGEPGNDEAVEKEHVPAKYNAKSQMAIEIKDAAIKEITFRLTSD